MSRRKTRFRVSEVIRIRVRFAPSACPPLIDGSSGRRYNKRKRPKMEFAQVIQIITTTTALIAVVVSPVISIVVARKQIWASVVSSNRQKWIDNLRDTLAEFLSKEAMARQITARELKEESSAVTLARIEDVVRLAYKIELLAADEPAHKQLSELVFDLVNSINQLKPENKIVDTQTCMERIVTIAKGIFKEEWDKVKRGD